MLRAGRTTVVLTVLFTLGLAGCQDEEPAPPATAETEANNDSQAAGGPTSPASPPPTAPEAATVIDSATNSVSYVRFQAQMRADINELVSDDQIATVNFTLTLESVGGGRGEEIDHFPVSDIFGEEVRDHSVGGTYLVDPAEQKRYLVYRDADGACVCSEFLGELRVGQPVALFASFPAPPPTTDSMTVVIPNFPLFRDVPVTRTDA